MPVSAKNEVPRVARVSLVPLAACKLRSSALCIALYLAPFKARSSLQSPTPLFVLPLDSEGGVLSAPVLVSLGHEVGTTAIDVKDVFREALKVGADAIIVAHNHPSGDLTPSKGDVETTKELQSLSDRLGLKFIDHLIIGKSGFTSVMLMIAFLERI